jgi:ABC-type phosphate/phosphonate transport system substrate-binding protein
MASEGKINLKDVKVLNKKSYEDFPFLVSTQLYPEWPMAKTKFTDDELAKKVENALLKMQEDNQAAIKASIKGWTLPENYNSVENMMAELNITKME